MTRRIRIIDTPPGEAPQHIREAWIGCVLPVIAVPGEPRARSVCRGVLTGKRTEDRDRYLVPAPDAIAVLARRDRDAAQWWRESVPSGIAPGRLLAFPEEVCERLMDLPALRLPRMTARRWKSLIFLVAVGIVAAAISLGEGGCRLWPVSRSTSVER